MNYTKLDSYILGFCCNYSLGNHLFLFLSYHRNGCHWMNAPYLLLLLQETLIGNSWGKWHN